MSTIQSSVLSHNIDIDIGRGQPAVAVRWPDTHALLDSFWLG